MAEKKRKRSYKDGLDPSTREQYEQKTACLGFDPYEAERSSLSNDPDCLPAITYMDILNYLVNSKSAYTFQELKAVKSLEAYNQFVNGWVKDVLSVEKNGVVLVIGRVRHSQCMNATPLKPWLIARPDGTVDSAHCDCMAGLGEACSHVGALLFYVDHVYQARSSLTVTQRKAYWPVPSYVDKVTYAEVKDIDFTSVDTQRKHLECSLTGEPTKKRSTLKLPNVDAPTSEEISALNNTLFETGTMPAVLSVVSGFQKHYVPDILREDKLPLCLTRLKNETYMNMESDELKKECLDIFNNMTVTTEQARHAEIITRGQASSKEWHALRQGRITASNVKSVCSGSVDKPAISTVNNICGTRKKFSSKATKWGCDHEKTALSMYKSTMESDHVNLSVELCGLFINPKYVHLGASPDALVKCDCCGEGLVEVKCPYCVRNQKIDKDIGYIENGKLKPEHKYHYQVQTQLLVTERNYCDFVVWTEQDISIERIHHNTVIQELIKTKSTDYFVKIILPEVTGSLITRQLQCSQPSREQLVALDSNNSSIPGPSGSQGQLICICQKLYNVNDGDVIGCDDENCPYVWLHFSCMKIKRVPKVKYFCPNCKKHQPKRQRKH